MASRSIRAASLGARSPSTRVGALSGAASGVGGRCSAAASRAAARPVSGRPQAEQNLRVAAVQLAARGARAADAGLAQDGLRMRAAETMLEREELAVERRDALRLAADEGLLVHAVTAAQAMDLVDQPPEVAQQQLTHAAQVARPPAQAGAAFGRRGGPAQLLGLETGREVAHCGQGLLGPRGLGGRGRVARLAGRRRLGPALLGGGGAAGVRRMRRNRPLMLAGA